MHIFDCTLPGNLIRQAIRESKKESKRMEKKQNFIKAKNKK